MPIIEVSKLVKQDKNKAYNLLKNIENFPQFMKNIRSIKILERGEKKIIANWNVVIDGAEIFWKEEDSFDEKNCKVDFRMLEGDYNKYTGTWSVEEDKKGSRIILKVDIDWGIPILGKHVGRILERKARANFKRMLTTIVNRLENIY